MNETASIAPPATDSSMADAVERAVQQRHSCRGFRPDPVPRTLIERILRISQSTPSWCNSQAWQLVVTEGQATPDFRTALFAEASRRMADPGADQGAPDFPTPERYDGIYAERRRACGLALYQSLGIAREDRAGAARAMLNNFDLFGAPHVMIVTTPRDLGPYGAVDCGGFVSTFMTVAQAHGVATIAQGALATYSQFVRAHFGIGDDRLLLCGISFGYEDSAAPANGFRTGRASLDEVVSWRTGAEAG
ncbi:nitroreductase [Rhizorhabdus dicambivorans]|uniref:Nitroreductase n=1 Tax=Rhizorhabdus dicambivorans TaxID=1850238 RepID=A0A2A4FYI4_9SPHN|nr:nitroreductase [Rhizorhabdus dicambivorans]PCE42767.1 nitroreductase [Rhizorhabdus dicambivorans]